MKKIINKILIILILIVMIFEFSFCNTISYAAEDYTTEVVNSLSNIIGGVVSVILWIHRILIVGATYIFGVVITQNFAGAFGQNNEGFEERTGLSSLIATPYDIFFNRYKIFDVNFFDLNPNQDSTILVIRTNVAKWFYILRNFSAAFLLCVLIYVGIRMAISSVADDKAKYKKMLVDWCCSLVLIFVLQYIAIFTIEVNGIIIRFLKNITTDMGMSTAMADLANKAMWEIGMGSIVSTIVYIMLVFQVIFFMIAYLQRVLKVAFLIIISPLISITYSIDKIGDGKAQALNAWLKEFVYTILIQPFHAIIYLAFVNSAMSLIGEESAYSIPAISDAFGGSVNSISSGILALLCIKFINDAETAVRKIFNFQDDNSSTSMAAGAALGMAALSTMGKAKNMGVGVAKKFNKATGLSSKFKNMKAEIGEKFQSSPLGAKLKSRVDKFKNSPTVRRTKDRIESANKKWTRTNKGVNKLKNVKAKVRKSSFGKNTKKALHLARKSIRRSMPATMAIMGAAMSYATGTSGVMAAIGTGNVMKEATEGYFNSTKGTISDVVGKTVDQGAENAFELAKINAKEFLSYNEERNQNGSEEEQVNANNAKDILDEENIKPFDEEEIREKSADELEQREEEIAKQKDRKSRARKLIKAMELTDPSKESEVKKQFMQNYKSELGIEQLMAQPNSTANLEAKKNEILQKILELKMKQNKEISQTDQDQVNELSEKDTDSADRTMKTITDSIDSSIVRGGGDMDMAKLIRERIGLIDTSETSHEYQSIYKAILEYEQMSRGNYVKSNFSNAESLNINRDSLLKSSSKKTSQ